MELTGERPTRGNGMSDWRFEGASSTSGLTVMIRIRFPKVNYHLEPTNTTNLIWLILETEWPLLWFHICFVHNTKLFKSIKNYPPSEKCCVSKNYPTLRKDLQRVLCVSPSRSATLPSSFSRSLLPILLFILVSVQLRQIFTLAAR